MIDIKSIENIIGYTFQNKNLLIQAFTHPSYSHMTGMLDNDRMEEWKKRESEAEEFKDS